MRDEVRVDFSSEVSDSSILVIIESVYDTMALLLPITACSGAELALIGFEPGGDSALMYCVTAYYPNYPTGVGQLSDAVVDKCQADLSCLLLRTIDSEKVAAAAADKL